MNTPGQQFEQRIAEFTKLENAEAKRHKLMGLLRGAVFLVGASSAVYLFYTDRNGWGLQMDNVRSL